MVQLLIANARVQCHDGATLDAVVNAVDSLGCTPLDGAAKNAHFTQTPDYKQIVECLREAGGKLNMEPRFRALRAIDVCAAAARGDAAHLHRLFIVGGVSAIELVAAFFFLLFFLSFFFFFYFIF